MKSTKQNITVFFRDGSSRTIENFMAHQVGGEAIQIVFGTKAVIYPMAMVSMVEIEQYEAEEGVVDVVEINKE